MHPDMNWEDVRVAHVAGQERSLSGASRSLGISQPTLSRRLRALEESLGTRLFERLPQGLEPTEAGERMLPLFAEMATAAEAVERARRGTESSRGGSVRISSDETRTRFLTDTLPEFREMVPEVELEILSTQTEANLSRREADLLIRECLPDGASLIVRKLGTIHYAVYGADSYVARNPMATQPSQRSECDWVGFAEDRLFFSVQKRWVDQQVSRPPIVRTNHATVMQDAVRAGVGLGLLPCFVGDRTPGLVRLTPPITALAAPQHLLIHRDVLRDPPVRATVDALVVLFKRHKAVLEGIATRQDSHLTAAE